ncbi:MAG: uroporphyrinogen decarboxylase [Planctomycetota bacterium]
MTESATIPTATTDPGATWQRAASDAPFLQAARGERPSRRPIWIMRQAGRYLPEYRAVRGGVSFLELCNTPEAAAEVTLQPLRRYDLDAAILFTDLLVPLPPMGVELDYEPGPVLKRTIETEADVDGLRVPEPSRDLAPMLETARRVRAALPADKALLGFVGAPFTMACYLIEGRGSKDWSKTRRVMHGQPELFDRLLGRIADALAPLVTALIQNGCDGIQVFDSWASVLDRKSYERHCAPVTQRLLRAAKDGGALAIDFVNGAFQHLDAMQASCADVLAVDWRHDMAEFRQRVGASRALQGNLDPTALFAPKEELVARVRDVCAGAGPAAHVFNLGHGVLPQTDPDSLNVVIDTVRSLG